MEKKTAAVLEVVEGPENIRGKRVEHRGVPLVIGRAPQADLTIPDPKVSKNHAVIEKRGSSYFLVDLESLNGTILNGERIIRPEGAKLQHGDDIVIAGYKIKFYIFSGLEEGEYRTIQKRITMNAIQKYSTSSAVLYVEIPRFRELYTKYPAADVDGLKKRFHDLFREIVHEGAPYYAQPLGEKAFAFFESPSHAIDFGMEFLRKSEKVGLELLRNAEAKIRKFEVRIGIDAGPLSIMLGDEGRIEQVTGAVMSRARIIAGVSGSGELTISEAVFGAVPEKSRPSWVKVEAPAESKLGIVYKYQSDSTARI